MFIVLRAELKNNPTTSRLENNLELSATSFFNVKIRNEKRFVAQVDRSLSFVELLTKQEKVIIGSTRRRTAATKFCQLLNFLIDHSLRGNDNDRLPRLR